MVVALYMPYRVRHVPAVGGFGIYIDVQGPPMHLAVPYIFAVMVGFLSNLTTTEGHRPIMVTFDAPHLQPHLQPGMTAQSKVGSRKGSRR